MGIREAVADYLMREKLKRGRCRDCAKPLRDDRTSPFCSPACHDEWLRKNF